MIERVVWSPANGEQIRDLLYRAKRHASVSTDDGSLRLHCGCRKGLTHALVLAPGGVLCYDGNTIWREREESS